MRHPYVLILSALVFVFVGASGVRADTVEIGPLAVPALSIDGDQFAGSLSEAAAVEVEQFDPGLGILQNIRLDLRVDFAGTAGFENTSTLTSFITTTVAWDFALLDDPNGTEIMNTDAERVFVSLAEGFDGNLDFAGFSGRTYDPNDGMIGTGLAEVTTDDAGLLALFTGPGTVELAALVEYAVTITGLPPVDTEQIAANMQVAGGELTVTYDYIIPEPGGLALLVAPLVLRCRR